MPCSAEMLNALIEADRVAVLQGAPEVVVTPSASGKGQRIARCPRCHLALWSNYAGAGERFHFLRVGTLDDPDRLPPDVHIFTASKQPWFDLPQIGRAHVCTPVTNAHLVCRLLLDKKKTLLSNI